MPIIGIYWLLIDPALLFVSGSSAGAHMASLAALTPNDPTFQPGFEGADSSVTAAIGLNGWYGGYLGQPDVSSPLAHVRPDVGHRSSSPSTPSTCSAPSASSRSSTPSKPSPPGFDRARSGRVTI